MKRILLFLFLLPFFGFGQTDLVKWNAELSNPNRYNPTYINTDVTSTNLTVNGGVSLSYTSNNSENTFFQTGGWPTPQQNAGQYDPEKYIQFTIKPIIGKKINLSNFTFQCRSGGGKFRVKYSKSSDFTSGVKDLIEETENLSSWTPYTISFSPEINPVLDNETVYIRIYSYSTNNDFQIQTGTGTINKVPLIRGTVSSFDSSKILAINDYVETKKDLNVNIDALNNDVSNSKVTSLVISTPPSSAEGTVIINPDNTITFNPQQGFTGTSIFSYTISNSNASPTETSTGSIQVTISENTDNTLSLWNGASSSFKPITNMYVKSEAPVTSVGASLAYTYENTTSAFFQTGNWPSGPSIETGKYVEFKISPDANHQLNLNDFSFVYRSQGNSANFQVKYSKDPQFITGVKNLKSVITSSSSWLTFSEPFATDINPVQSTETVYVRIYVYNTNNAFLILNGNGNSVGPKITGTVKDISTLTANNDYVSTSLNQQAIIQILSNDIIGSSPIKEITFTQPLNGIVTLDSNNNIIFTATNEVTGITSFAYTLKNEATPPKYSSATVYVTVTPPTYLAPTISSFTPATGCTGSSVVINGNNFTGTTAVSFNEVSASSFTVNSDIQITAISPLNATTGIIKVTNPAGIATSSANITVLSGPAIGTITEPSFLESNSIGNKFSISTVTGATTYEWLVTGLGWSVTDGVNTTEATITVGSGEGTITFNATNTCGTTSVSITRTGSASPASLPEAVVLVVNPTCFAPLGLLVVNRPVDEDLSKIFTYVVIGPLADPITKTNTVGSFDLPQAGEYKVIVYDDLDVAVERVYITITPSEATVVKEWKGIDTNWNNTSNWSDETLPSASVCVLIKKDSPNMPVVSDKSQLTQVYSLKVEDGALLTIKEGCSLIVKNIVIVEGVNGLVFENNSSLVQVDDVKNTGKIIYQRTSQPMNNFDFTYWGSPVKGQNIINLSPNTFWDKYNQFNPETGWFLYEGDMVPGIGYNIRVPKAGLWPNGENVSFPYPQPVEFIGIPNNGNIPGEAVVSGRNYLVGNPYPSALDADKFLEANKDWLEGTIYFWTHKTPISTTPNASGQYVYSSNDFASYNLVGSTGTNPTAQVPDGNIAAGQSFFTTGIGSGTIQFTNVMRVAGQNDQFFKFNSITEKNRVWLNLTNENGTFKQLLIGYVTDATNEYDARFDGRTFGGNPSNDFYSINSGSNLVIQGRALPFDTNDEVPLGFKTTTDGSFTISIDHSDGNLATQDIFIEDKLNATTYNLRKSDYTFTTVKGTFHDRFVLKYTNKTLGTDGFETVPESTVVAVKNKIITVSTAEGVIEKVQLYDISGKAIYTLDSVDNATVLISNLKSSNQMLIVKVILDNGQVRTKKIIF